jgi:hypothetical protein
MLRFFDLPERFVVLPEFKREISAALEQTIATIWRKEKAERGSRLFNGQLFSTEEVSAGCVIGCFVEYRLFLAQLRRPELFSELRVQPLAVTGLLQNSEGLFFGLRSSTSALQPNRWELVPAGGIDAGRMSETGDIEPDAQLLAELGEEVGLKPSDVRSPRLVGFCEEPELHIFDLVFDLETTLETTAIVSAHTALRNPEHEGIRCVPWKDVEGFIADHHLEIAAGNRELLRHINPAKRRMHPSD